MGAKGRKDESCCYQTALSIILGLSSLLQLPFVATENDEMALLYINIIIVFFCLYFMEVR